MIDLAKTRNGLRAFVRPMSVVCGPNYTELFLITRW